MDSIDPCGCRCSKWLSAVYIRVLFLVPGRLNSLTGSTIPQLGTVQQEDSRQLNPNPSLQNAGDNGRPSSAFPLQNCQGDCDAE